VIDKSFIQICGKAALDAYLENDKLAIDRPSAIPFFGEETDTHGFVQDMGTFVLVSFRGTTSMHNWLTDVLVRQTDIGNGMKVHTGFLKAWNSVKPKVDAAIARITTGNLPVFFTGHSLGAALAKLAFWDSKYTRRLVTFGQPRVGNKAFALAVRAASEGRYVRVIDKEDMVPHLAFMMGRYRHTGDTIFYDELGIEHDGLPFWHMTAMIAAGLAWEYYHRHFGVEIDDHAMEQYIERISA
jgi:triacylglycerol lipase